MIWNTTEPKEKAAPCLLCHEAPCTSACPHGLDPAGILRSVRFENEAGAAMRLPGQDLCARCAAPCQDACLRPDGPVQIRRVCMALHQEKGRLEELGEKRVDLSSEFCGVKLENPFLLSSSVVASSYEKVARAFDMGWAGACLKTIYDFIPREASPRYSALSDGGCFYGFKNIEQLSCASLEADLDIIRRLKRDYPTKVIIASIMGRDEAEWTRLARLVEEAGADLVECNFSCPNMEQDGLGVDVGQSPEAVERYTAAARRGCSVPLLAKLTPNVGDMRPMALAARRGGADGLAAINTVKSIMGMNLDTYATSPSVRGLSGVGGYSGKAVKPIALHFIWELASCPEWPVPPISGMGGIETWRDAVEFLLLGADHVQITTAVMQYGLRVIDDLLEGLTLYLREKALDRVTELRGLGAENVAALEELERESILLPRFDRSRCVGCGRCVLSCRDGGHEALAMGRGGPVMDPTACVGCHLCVLVCPVHAVSGFGRRLSREQLNRSRSSTVSPGKEGTP